MSHLTTLFVVGPDEYVEFNESLGSKAMLQHVWDEQTTPLNKEETASTRLHSSGARISSTPPPRIEFPTIKRLKGKGNNYQPTGKWFSWEELARRNPLAVCPPPSIESLRKKAKGDLSSSSEFKKDESGDGTSNPIGKGEEKGKDEEVRIGEAPRVQPGSWLIEKAKKPIDSRSNAKNSGASVSKYASTPLDSNGFQPQDEKPSTTATTKSSSTTSKPSTPSKPSTSNSGTSSIDALLQRVRMYSSRPSGTTPSPSTSKIETSTSPSNRPSQPKSPSKTKANQVDLDNGEKPIPSLAFRLGEKVDDKEMKNEMEKGEKKLKGQTREEGCQTDSMTSNVASQRNIKNLATSPTDSTTSPEAPSTYTSTFNSTSTSNTIIDPRIPTGPRSQSSPPKSKKTKSASKAQEKEKAQGIRKSSISSSSSTGNGIGARGSTFKEEFDSLKSPPVGSTQSNRAANLQKYDSREEVDSKKEEKVNGKTAGKKVEKVKDARNETPSSDATTGSGSSRWAHSEPSVGGEKKNGKAPGGSVKVSGEASAIPTSTINSHTKSSTPIQTTNTSAASNTTTVAPDPTTSSTDKLSKPEETEDSKKKSFKEKKKEKEKERKEKRKEKELLEKETLNTSNSDSLTATQMERKMSQASELSIAETVKSDVTKDSYSKKSEKIPEKKSEAESLERRSSKVGRSSTSAEGSSSKTQATESQVSQIPSDDHSTAPLTSVNPLQTSPLDSTSSATIPTSNSISSISSSSSSSALNWADDDDEDDTLPDLEDWGISVPAIPTSPSKTNGLPSGLSLSSHSNGDGAPNGRQDSNGRNGASNLDGMLGGTRGGEGEFRADRINSGNPIGNEGESGARNSGGKRGQKRAGKGRGKKDRSGEGSDSLLSQESTSNSAAPPSAPMGMRIAGRASASNATLDSTSTTTSNHHLRPTAMNDVSIPSGPRAFRHQPPSAPWSNHSNPSDKSNTTSNHFSSTKSNYPQRGGRAGIELLNFPPSTQSTFSKDQFNPHSSDSRRERVPSNSRPRIMGGGAFSRLTKGIVAVQDEKRES